MVIACRKCFSYIGGLPQEMVFDQDSVVSVSENYGDVVHTYEFEKLRQECKFDVYLCRRSDPESKGKIESVVKFVKQNFLENRIYSDDETLNWSAAEMFYNAFFIVINNLSPLLSYSLYFTYLIRAPPFSFLLNF